MKSVKKYLFLMAVVAALFGFVACSSDDDGASEVAVYTQASESWTLTFYDDKTFKNVQTIAGKDYTVATGTYKGDVRKDTDDGNKVTATVKKYAYVKAGDTKPTLVSIKDYAEYASKTFSYMTKEEIIEYYTDMPVTIKGDRLTVKEFGTFTKYNKDK